MVSLISLQRGWNQFFFSTTDASILGIFRIIMGVIFLLNGLSLVEDFYYWYGVGNESLVPLVDSLSFYTDPRINLFKVLPPKMASAGLILFSYIIFSFFVMIGYKTKLSTAILFILIVSLQNRNYAILNSGDTVMRCLLFAMIWAPCGNCYSVDASHARKAGRRLKKTIPIVGIRLIQIQFAIVYLSTALFKFNGGDWVDGTAVYYTSRLENFQRIVVPVLFDHLSLIQFMTWFALFTEFAMGTLVWIKELRIWVLLAGVLLHIGIELTMSIGFFEWVMFAGYIVFLKGSDIKQLSLLYSKLRDKIFFESESLNPTL